MISRRYFIHSSQGYRRSVQHLLVALNFKERHSVEMDPVRKNLEALIAARGESYSGLSELIGRNSAYIHQFIRRGTPRKLSENDRRILAKYFGISEELLGGPAPSASAERRPQRMCSVPVLPLGASAGAGAIDPVEQPSSSISFDDRWLRHLGVRPGRVSIIRVEGDSMTPTLCDGDEIMIDHDDGAERLREGLYVFRMDGVLMVKRLTLGPRRGQLCVSSDNPTYPRWPDVALDQMIIVGRVVWFARQLRRR